MKVLKDNQSYLISDGYEWFWVIFEDGTWEPNTFKIFDKFIDENTTVLDIGAWIGPTVLYAGFKAKKVYAFEPDPVAFKHLEWNVCVNKLDDKVWIAPLAVSNEMKIIDLGVRGNPGDSMSSILWTKDIEKVAAIPFHAALLDSGAKFVKIDIEGGEIELLKGAAIILEACQPTVHLSLHTPWFEGKKLDKYREVIKEALRGYPTILNEKLEPTTIDEMLAITDYFTSFVATYDTIS